MFVLINIPLGMGLTGNLINEIWIKIPTWGNLWCHDTQPNDNKHNDTKHNRHNCATQYYHYVSLRWESHFYCYAECRYTECHIIYCAEYHYTECHVFIVMLNIVILSVTFVLSC